MSRSRVLSVTAGIPLVLLVLTSCFLLPEAPVATQGASPSSNAETATPKPPEPKALPARVPLECGDLMPLSAIAAVLEVPESRLELRSEPMDFYTAAHIQGGDFSCVWAERGVPYHESRNLNVAILTNGTTAFSIYQSHHLPAVDAMQPGDLRDAIGQDSYFYCSAASFRSCIGEFEWNGYWVHFSMDGRIGKGESPTSAAPALSVGEKISAALTAAGDPVIEYFVPAESIEAWSDCEELNHNGSYLRDVGSPSLQLFTFSESAPGDNHIGIVAGLRAGTAACWWTEKSPGDTQTDELYFLEASMLPGGEWAWPDVKAAALANPLGAVAAVDGADDAVRWCEADAYKSDCWVVALFGHAIVRIAAHSTPESTTDVPAAAIDAMRYLIRRL